MPARGSASSSTSSTRDTALLEVGRIAKAHGIRGEVLVQLVTNRTERVAPGTALRTPDGAVLVIRESTPHQGRWIVAFEGVPDRTAAEALRGTVLCAEPIADPDALWVHELIGSEVVDVGGTSHGRVTSVIANPASDLLELESGALIPLRFVSSRSPGVIVVDPPAGLLEPDG
ncbi:MAG: ribosome maturation factor RimM [Acidimicrobiales bacterium]